MRRSIRINPIKCINWTIVAVLLIFAVWIAVGFYRARQIPFDAERWKYATSAIHPDVRFRMAQDLSVRLRKIRSLTDEDVRALLGTPTRQDLERRVLRYNLGRKHVGPFPTGEYYLVLAFRKESDEHYVVSAITIVPE
jgi:hypothetical protein